VAPAGDSLRLLVVEDNADDREFLVRSLRKSGLEFEWQGVSTLQEFKAALEQPPGGSWSVVLCDYQLVDFDALVALTVVKERGLDVPFILVSGVLGEDAAVAAMRAGAHDFFAKGRLTRLRAAIERELAEARVRAEKRQAEADRDKLLHELQGALAARDEFLVLASHELRTPLTILGLQVDGLIRPLNRAGTPPPPGLIAMRRQLDWFGVLVDRCFDVTKLSSEPLVLAKRQADLRAIVLDTVERSRDWIDQAGCTLVLEPLESVVGDCWDPVRLASVVTNLLANALKYGRGRTVTLSTQRDGDWAVLGVQDHGIGISSEDLAKLFGKFSRAVPYNNYGGLGLGLWVVDQVTRAHGGTVQVESQKVTGARFTVRLPMHVA
jgi:signal transduction histidine kinase